MLKAAYGGRESRAETLRRFLTLDAGGWRVAVDGNTILGCVGALDYGRFAYVGMMAVLLPICLAAGAVSYVLIERPFLTRRRTWSPDEVAKNKGEAAAPAAAEAALEAAPETITVPATAPASGLA